MPCGLPHTRTGILHKAKERVPDRRDTCPDMTGTQILRCRQSVYYLLALRQDQQFLDFDLADMVFALSVSGFLMAVHSNCLSHDALTPNPSPNAGRGAILVIISTSSTLRE